MTNVSSIMSKDPVKAGRNAPLKKAISLMVRHGVGSVIVVDTNNMPKGIVTERELLRDITEHGRVSTDKPLSEIMSRNFVPISPTTTVEDAARNKASRGRRLVVVKKDGELFGIVSTSDLLHHFNKTARDVEIERVISRKVVTMDASIGLLGAIKVMKEKRIGSVIVTEFDLPSGIVTERDLLRVLAKRRKTGFGTLLLQDVAAKPLISAAYGIKAREASSIMLGNKIKRLPLFRGQRLEAMVTAKDLVRAYSDDIKIRKARAVRLYAARPKS